jgi:hypothetical protein
MLEMGSMEVQFSKKAESSPWPPVSLGKGEAADIYWLVLIAWDATWLRSPSSV